MAKEKGFYKDENLDVDIKEFNGGSVVNEVLKGRADFGISDYSLIEDRLKGKKVVAVMPIFNNTPLAIVSINPKVNSVSKFKKAVICSPLKNLNSLAMSLFLNENGLKKNDLIIKKSFFSKKSIISKECDLYPIYETDQLYYLNKWHIPYKLFSIKDTNLPLYGDILFTSEKFRFSHPEIVEKFKKASIKGWKYVLSHPDETIKVILNKYNTQHLSYDKLYDEALKTRKYITNFEFDIKKIKEVEFITKILLSLKGNINLVDFIYSKYIKTKQEANFIKKHVIKTANTPNWPPFEMYDKGVLKGIGPDVFNIIKNKLFLKSENIIVSWDEVLNLIKSNKADITFSTMKTKDKSFAIFSKPYVVYPISIAVKKSFNFISDIDDLRDKKIAIGKDYTVYQLIKEHYPYFNIIAVRNTKEALKMLSRGKVDAVIDIMPVLAYYISHMHLYDIKIAGKTPFEFKVSFMLSKNNEILRTLINRVIKDIPDSTKKRILSKYINVSIQNGYTKEYIKIRYLWFKIIVIFLLLIIAILIFQLYKIKQLQQELILLAYHDQLTSIYNRRKTKDFLEEYIKYSKRYNTPLSLIYFDIDFFKKINDTYGHDKGDFVLKELSRIVKLNLRDSDIFGRWGGEEFLIILPNTDINGAKKVAEKIRTAVKNSDFDGINVTISLGITQLNMNDDVDSFINRADRALYKAKRNGRNRVEIA